MELDDFKEKTDQLMSDLDNNDITSALSRINEINEINGKNFYSVIGKLTRGLHDAISDLSISSAQDQAENDMTRVDLNYVISLTDGAAKKTLDMTERSRSNIHNLSKNYTEQSNLLEEYSKTAAADQESLDFVREMTSYCEDGNQNIVELNANISEIVVAQNFQDIASQSITKAINIIKEVENSLVALTQYANLLKKLSQYSSHSGGDMDIKDSEELKTNIGQLNDIHEHEHLDQHDVDNLLSSLGF
jgi:chemotaxis protein CheZ